MYLVQVVRDFCRWIGTDIPGKRSFDSLDVSHELLFYLLTIWSAQLLFRQFICAQCVHSAACWHAAVQH